MAAHHSPSPATADREIVNTRVIDVPRERVFAAWTDPKRLALWWGPDGFTNTFHEFDLRPGGAWRFIMHGPDGADYPNHSQFVEIVSPERFVFDHISDHYFRMTVTFDDLGGQTRVTMRMSFNTVADCVQVRAVVVPCNEQNLDRLAAHLTLA